MPRQAGALQARLEYAPIALARAALASLPLERAMRVGAVIGQVAMAGDRRGRAIALRNLEIAFPALTIEARLAILRASWRNWGRMAAEWAHLGELDRANIGRIVTWEGYDNLAMAQQRSDDRGILVLTGHFGNWELMGVACALYDLRPSIIHRPLRNPRVEAEISAVRARFGVVSIPRKSAGREIVRRLREGRMVAVPLDLDVRDGVFVDFFSLKACTTDALARLAMATGAPVLPAFIVREGSGVRHQIRLLPPCEVAKSRDRDESIRENTQRFAALVEAMIQQHPDHWNWIHRRWKTRPPGEARFY